MSKQNAKLKKIKMVTFSKKEKRDSKVKTNEQNGDFQIPTSRHRSCCALAIDDRRRGLRAFVANEV